MKKAAIIIGVTLVGLAVVFSILAYNITNSKNDPKVTPTPPIETVSPTQTPEYTTPEDIIPEQTPQIEVVEKEVEISGVRTIDASALTNPSDVKDEIVIISSKRVILLDEHIGHEDGKMLTYCFDVFTPDNTKLVLYVTNSAYDNYEIGDKLKVTYVIYTNDVGVKIPLVSSVVDIVT